jgi:Mlc titration factor MtfA (ptsG expression regulator)
LYAEGSAEERERFEARVLVALDTWSIEAVDGVDLTDELRLMVGAGVGVMLWGHPEWDVPEGRSFLLYPGTFDDEYSTVDDARDFDGMAHPQGPVILSAPAVEEGWRRRNGYNVVLHELAHVFDFDPEGADGLPAFLDPRSAEAWQDLVREEMAQARTGRSLLRPYAGTNAAELFAVSTEVFFERPARLRERHPDLYDALRAVYNVDPPDEPPPEASGGSLMARRWG